MCYRGNHNFTNNKLMTIIVLYFVFLERTQNKNLSALIPNTNHNKYKP